MKFLIALMFLACGLLIGGEFVTAIHFARKFW